MWLETRVLQDKQWWGPLFMWILTQDLSLSFFIDFSFYQFQYQRIAILCHLTSETKETQFISRSWGVKVE
jgi:hypothetical protein